MLPWLRSSKRRFSLPPVEELAGVVDVPVAPAAVEPLPKRLPVDFLHGAVRRPEDAVLAVGDIDEVAPALLAAGLGAPRVPDRRVDDHRRSGRQAVDADRAGQILRPEQGQAPRNHGVLRPRQHQQVADLAVEAVQVVEDVHHHVRAVGVRLLLVVLVPVDAAFAGVVAVRVDVMHGEARAHQRLDHGHHRRMRGEQSHLAVGGEQRLRPAGALGHQLVDLGDQAGVVRGLQEALQDHVPVAPKVLRLLRRQAGGARFGAHRSRSAVTAACRRVHAASTSGSGLRQVGPERAERVRRVVLQRRRGQVARVEAGRRKQVTGVGDVVEGGELDADGAADRALQHAADPDRNAGVPCHVVDGQRARKPAHARRLDVDVAAGRRCGSPARRCAGRRWSRPGRWACRSAWPARRGRGCRCGAGAAR